MQNTPRSSSFTPGCIPIEMYISGPCKKHARIFVTALSVIAPKLKLLKWPSPVERMNKLWDTPEWSTMQQWKWTTLTQQSTEPWSQTTEQKPSTTDEHRLCDSIHTRRKGNEQSSSQRAEARTGGSFWGKWGRDQTGAGWGWGVPCSGYVGEFMTISQSVHLICIFFKNIFYFGETFKCEQKNYQKYWKTVQKIYFRDSCILLQAFCLNKK